MDRLTLQPNNTATATAEYTQRVSISERLLVIRINNKLRHRGLWFRKARAKVLPALGSSYLVDCNLNVVVRHHLNLEEFARACSCLKDYEVLGD